MAPGRKVDCIALTPPQVCTADPPLGLILEFRVRRVPRFGLISLPQRPRKILRKINGSQNRWLSMWPVSYFFPHGSSSPYPPNHPFVISVPRRPCLSTRHQMNSIKWSFSMFPFHSVTRCPGGPRREDKEQNLQFPSRLQQFHVRLFPPFFSFEIEVVLFCRGFTLFAPVRPDPSVTS